ncbi:cysteine-rich CWC family protein [Shewanella youngdeokensis]|uniref:Cysteine-rich CWC family protein n=1 Tax=Shewanella youngdeokensis TaxID=2999068 RepID=A0ABZ0JZH5_9GAMM|nr:cysteine-rich CWC family protein [Shewanella sp. DAU334]
MKSDASVCPRCQLQNGCSVLQGQSIEQCWCRTQAFPSKTILDSGKAAAGSTALLNSKACLCQACIQQLKQLEDSQLFIQVD